MARKTKSVTIELPGRDAGKHFLITEMSAAQGAHWVMKVFAAVGPFIANQQRSLLNEGMAGIARIGLGAILQMPFEKTEPLLAELMACVLRVEDPRRPFPRALVSDPHNPDGDDIEEISTTFFLQGEVFEVMTGFSMAAWIAESRAAALEDQDQESSPSTPISTASSELSSQAA